MVVSDGGVAVVGLRLLGCFKKIYIYIYIYRERERERERERVFRYRSLDSPFKILSYGFFLMGWKNIF